MAPIFSGKQLARCFGIISTDGLCHPFKYWQSIILAQKELSVLLCAKQTIKLGVIQLFRISTTSVYS